MSFKRFAKIISDRVCPEKILLSCLNSLLKFENLSQLPARIAQLSRINLFEKQRDVANLRFAIERFRYYPFFFCPRSMPATCGCTPPIVQNKNRIVTPSEVFIYKF